MYIHIYSTYIQSVDGYYPDLALASVVFALFIMTAINFIKEVWPSRSADFCCVHVAA